MYVPWGDHTITFDYQPRRVYAGVLISVLSVIAVGIALFVKRLGETDSPMEKRICASRNAHEWRWVIIWIVVALIITSVPYVVGWLRSTPDQVFGGFVFAIEDGNFVSGQDE